MALYLKDALFVDWQSLEVKKTCLAVEEGPQNGISLIAAVPSHDKLAPGDRLLDCAGKLVTRSFGCGHHHIYSTLARGMPAPQKSPVNFVEILKYIWWHLDKCLDLEMIEASALASAIYCAKNGVTLIVDHHASPFAVKDSLFTIARAFDRVGVSYLLCYEISDRDGEGVKDEGLAETDAYLAAGYQGHVGLHASFTVGDDLLTKAVALAGKHNTGLHMHVAEDLADQEQTLIRYNKRVVERLQQAGALNLKKSILSHCIHLSDQEKRLIHDSGVWVAQNVESNQNNNVGLASYKSITDNVLLGTDGMHSDMLRSAKAAFLAGQATEGIGFDEIYARFCDAHRYAREFGLRGDTDNNLVVLNYDSPTEVTSENFLGHFVFGIDSRHVTTVICQGKVIVEEGRVTTVNETEVLEHAREMGKKLWAAMKRRAQ